MSSSCELPGRIHQAGGVAHPPFPAQAPRRAKGHTWSGVAVQDYKQPAAHHCGVSRAVLAGESGERRLPRPLFRDRLGRLLDAGSSPSRTRRRGDAGAGPGAPGQTWHEEASATRCTSRSRSPPVRNVGREPFGFL